MLKSGMTKWHFDHTKGYVDALNAAYLRIQELEGGDEETEDKSGRNRRRKGQERSISLCWERQKTHHHL
jgi:superoxide dismutase